MLFSTLYPLISDKCTEIHGPFYGLGIMIAIIIMIAIDNHSNNKK